jgi:hypothetical protein
MCVPLSTSASLSVSVPLSPPSSLFVSPLPMCVCVCVCACMCGSSVCRGGWGAHVFYPSLSLTVREESVTMQVSVPETPCVLFPHSAPSVSSAPIMSLCMDAVPSPTLYLVFVLEWLSWSTP